jgi:hypothetical protein
MAMDSRSGTEQVSEDKVCKQHEGAVVFYEGECPLCASSDSKSETERKLQKELTAAKSKIRKLHNHLKESEDAKLELDNYKKLAQKYSEENSGLESRIAELEKSKPAPQLNEPTPDAPINLDLVSSGASEIQETAVLKTASEAQPDTKSSPPIQTNNVELSELPPVLQAAVRKYLELNEENNFSIVDFRNIWFLRFLLLGAGEIVSILLFTYSFIFLGTFLQYSYTNSYFPWTWGSHFTETSVVWNQFTLGIGISIVALASSMAAQFFIFERKLKH